MFNIRKIRDFLLKDVWSLQYYRESQTLRFMYRTIKIILIAVKGFTNDKVMLRASALTFYTLISIVPVLAMAFGIAKGFGFDDYLRAEIVKAFEGQEEVMNWVLKFANSFLEKSKGGVIAGVGVVMIIWSVMKVMSNIEGSFNDIWRVKKSRTWVRKFSDYISIMIFAPLFIITASSMNVFVTTAFSSLSASIKLIGFFAPLISFLFQFVPYILIWLVFCLVYIVMPNTKVKFLPALVAGIVAGSIFQVVQYVYLDLQIGVSNYNAIYGSFAALPLFLILLQSSWMILLLGAELCFAFQNVEKIESEAHTDQMSMYQRKVLSLLIMQDLVYAFKNGKGAVNASQIANKLNLPYRLVLDLLYDLIQCKIVSEVVATQPNETSFQPAVDIHQLSVCSVIEKLNHIDEEPFDLSHVGEVFEIKRLLAGFDKLLTESDFNTKLIDLKMVENQ
jgi:membrane protein